MESEYHYPQGLRRVLIGWSAMLASTMVAVDTTIANVALPHMQATMSAGQEEIVWVLTSYLVASAIATPLSGWLASRFGRKVMMLISVGGFTLASLACGLSNSLSMMVTARILQGVCGAGLVPLSQATMLDIYPPSQHGKAMAVFGLGAMLGPIIGPTLGGWITDTFSWRWVFFINLPIGMLSFGGMWFFQTDAVDKNPQRFDLFGFATVSVAIAAFQLMLDRGQQLDWFDSTEVSIEAGLCLLATWLAVVHMLTAKNSFLKPQLFADRNFAVGCLLSATIGVVAFATIPLIVVMMQKTLGYSPLRTGFVGAPRGVGTLIAMIVVSRFIGKLDARIFLGTGLALTAVGLLLYAGIDLMVDQRALVIAGLVQGFGAGLMFVPLSTVVFSTLAPALRNEGTAMYNLMRNIGSSLGISFLQAELIRDTATTQSRLVEGVRPDAPVVDWRLPDFDLGSLGSVARVHGAIMEQAGMIAYLEVYRMVAYVALAMIPTVLLLRRARRGGSPQPLPAME